MATMFRQLVAHQIALKNEKKFAEWLIEQVPAVVVLLDDNGNILHLNHFASQQLGTSKEQLLAKNFVQTCVDNRNSSIRELFENLIHRRKESQLIKFSSQHPSQMDKYFEWTCASLHSKKPNPPSPSEPISLATWFKNKFSEIFGHSGYSDSNKIGHSEATVVKFSDVELGTFSNHVKFSATSSHGMVLCLGQDITVQQQRESLLVQAKQDAERLASLKDAFVTNVSHELR
jgi:PAS domain S-box-containing protein